LPASCGVLNVSSHNTCTSLTTPWNCRSPESSGYDEALVVTKPGPGAGGVVCCRDS
jgi:hypothetical protein